MSDTRRALASLGRAPAGSLRALAESQPVTPRDAAVEEPAGEPGTLNLAAVKAKHGPDLFRLLLWLDGVLVTKGFPPISPWWLSFLRTFYASGKRWAVVMAGRGAGKSTVLTRVAVVEALFGERKIPPGQRWIWPFISVGVPDARRRILEIQAILTAIGVHEKNKRDEWWPLEPSYPQGVPTIETQDAGGNDIAFVALAGTIAGVSGPSSIGATIDEEAKLRDKATNANPATEILASLVQTFRARPGIRAIRCSSAWTEDGSHHASITAGSNTVNHVATIGEFLPEALAGHEAVARFEEERGNTKGAEQIRTFSASLSADSPNVPTWLGNPTISALASRMEVDALPPSALDGLDPTSWWLRENGSKPQPLGGAGRTFAGVEFSVVYVAPAGFDTVIGVAPPGDGANAWAIVAVNATHHGFNVAEMATAVDGQEAMAHVRTLVSVHRASVLACAADQERGLAGETQAALVGMGVTLAPIAPQAIYEGSELLAGPLRTLCQRGTLRFAAGLHEAMADALRAWSPDRRSPRVEALVAAVARLVACYPWLGSQTEQEPFAAPRPVEAMLVGGDPAREMLRRLGARV